ncbi:hypothetical protein CcCBS67573_g00065 [Chytriomyces confervae]|uniref:Uncharacterized protein n=1 Tax=Chytriomyces confervae TaxID=246404 RepID=A0A507FQH6_9FUNG|nr:hypothetical protein CcCBS67573_g00065 [Chytriomyces confervae]
MDSDEEEGCLQLEGIPLKGQPLRRKLRTYPEYSNNWNRDAAQSSTTKHASRNRTKKKCSDSRAATSLESVDGSFSTDTRSRSGTSCSGYSRSSRSESQSSQPSYKVNFSKRASNVTDASQQSFDDFGGQDLSGFMHDFHTSVHAEQQRKSLAARAEYLKSKLFGEIQERERALAPHAFGWQETPWTVHLDAHEYPQDGQTAIQGYPWIGERSKVDNFLESPVEADMWEALRHAEARAFPLEDEEVMEHVFEGLESAMMAQDEDALTQQWQERLNLGDRDIADRRAKEEMEITCQFRATPVPAASLLPRYDEIMRKMGNKSTEKRFQRANELMSKVKPFSFSCNGNHNESILHCRCKSQSNKVIQDAMLQIQQEKEQATKQKSRYLLTSETSLAAHAAEDGRKRRERLLANERNAGLTKEHKFKPKIKHAIPDFKKIHSEMQSMAVDGKSTKPKLVPEPFEGIEEHEREAQERSKRRVQKLQQKEEHAARRCGDFKAAKSPDYEYDHPPPLPCKETRSSFLKSRTAHEKIEKLEAELEAADTIKGSSKEKEKEMISKIQNRFKLVVDDKEERAESLKQQLRHQQRRREREYKKTLSGINEKLQERLCLFEQVSIENAKRRARAQVEQILREQRY